MNKERLIAGLETMGVGFDMTAIERFEAFHAILDEYNARMDLTAVLDEDERVDRHDLDRVRKIHERLKSSSMTNMDELFYSVGESAGESPKIRNRNRFRSGR